MASLATSTLVYSTPVRIKTSSKPRSSSRTCKKTVPFLVTRADSSSLLLHAAKHTVDKHIQSGMVVGLGSGQASGMAIQYLGRLLRTGALKDIVGVPMSVTSASEAAKAGIPLDVYQDSSQKKKHLLQSLDVGNHRATSPSLKRSQYSKQPISLYS